MQKLAYRTFLIVLPEAEAACASPRPVFAAGARSLLEMYGFVSVDVVEPSGLADQLRDRRYSCIVVLARADWSGVEARLAEMVAAAGCVFMEGPISDGLAGRLGLTVQSVSSSTSLAAHVASQDLGERLGHVLAGYASNERLDLGPITVDRSELDEAGRPSASAVPVESLWHAPFAEAQRLEGGDEIFATLEDGVSPLIVRRGTLIVAGFPVFELLCQRLGMAALDAPMRAARGERNGENLELAVLHAIADVAAAAGAPLVSVEPWPEQVRLVVTVRHDVDRPVAPDDWARLMAWYDAEPCGVSWYYLAQNVDEARMAETTAKGHEVALHYTNLASRGERELGALRAAAAEIGAPLTGATVHGGNFHGASDLRRLTAEGLRYGEILTRCTFFPFRPLDVDAEGRVARLPIWATARHASVDKRMSPPEADFGYGERTRNARRNMRSHVVIMNHPDINFEALQAAVGLYRGAGVESWTQADVIDWWARTHDNERADLSGEVDGDDIAIRYRCDALRRPMLRVWADVSSAASGSVAADNLGGVHALLSLDESGGARFQPL